MSCQSVIKIEQLTPDNYDIWKIQMESILIKSDLWDIVNSDAEIPSEAAGKPAWKKLDRKAKADLILAISPPLLKDVKDCSTSNQLWTKLKQTYDSNGPARKASLLKGLIISKMKGEENINDHISKFFSIVDKLKSIDIELDDDLLSILLLYSLPENFESFRIAIESRDELPKPEVLKVKIIEEYNARKIQSESGEVLIANQKNVNINFDRKNQHKREKNLKNVVCYNCRKWGHKPSQCRERFKVKERSSMVEEATMLIREENSRSNTWILDSGATSHMCADINKFMYLDPVKNSKINLANEETADIIGRGKVKINKNVSLSEVLCVPDLRTNLLSVSKITENNFDVIFLKERAIIKNKRNEVILEIKKRNGLYQIDENLNEANVAKENDELTVWHKRYGHLNYKTLREMIKERKVKGITSNIVRNDLEPKCEICIQGKHTRLPFEKNSNHRSSNPLEIIHSDVCGPIRTKSQGGAQYFVSFIDDYTRWCEIYVLKNKNQVLEMFQKFKATAENHIGKKIKILRSDNGKEYVNSKFSDFLEKEGIQHQLTVEYTPQQNGIAERKNRTLIEMARCMLIQANLPTSFWAEAISTANYIRNRSPSRSLNNEIPYKLWKGRNPNVKYFRTFGSLVYALDKVPNKGKFEKRSKPCLLMGYCDNSKPYRLWSKDTKNIIKSRDVIFINECDNEKKEIFGDIETRKKNILEIFEDYQEKRYIEPKNEEEKPGSNKDSTNKEKERENNDVGNSNERKENQESKGTREKKGRGRPRILRSGKRGRPRKVQGKPVTETEDEEEQRKDSTDEYETPNNEKSDSNDTPNFEGFLAFEECPTNIEDVQSSPHKNEWKNAMKRELEAHNKNQTWKVVKRPAGIKTIGCRWVFAVKTNQQGEITRRKARLVAKGYSQRPGIDYHETYAPVAKLKSIRILVAIAIEWNLKLYQYDIVTAYLHGDLEEDLYMCLPEGYEDLNGEQIEENSVCKLQKAIYGLKQSGRAWYKKLDKKLQNMGFKQLKTESCVYILKQDKEIILLIVYVDDIILATNNENNVGWFKDEIKKDFEINEIGDLNYCLGIEFNRTKDGIALTQQKFISKLLDKFGMKEANTTKTPLSPSEKIDRSMCAESPEERKKMKNIPYQNVIGSLLYLSITTRPDITFAVNFLSQFNKNFGRSHWVAAKRILRYLKGTINYGLHFKKTEDDLQGFVDADWASNKDDRRSYTGQQETKDCSFVNR